MVDNTPPEISCGFYTPQDAKYVSEDFDACLGKSPPFPESSDQLHIDAQNFRQKFVDVQLWFDIKTNTTDTKIDVDVRVLSNEFEGRPPIDDKMASILKRVDLPDIVNRVNLFIAPVSCQDGRPGASTICKAEEAMATVTGKGKTCHTWTSRGGLQLSTTNLIGNGHDYGVLLLAKTTTDDDANNINDNSRLEILAGVSFRLGGCNE
ncbi:hypothetical protein FRACYDRAFT_235350 [Fragilariopsis cylindrus CCMP1102]|uniref:Uncharacterized protein n=1 Tax=Fragilariopsis cylindrus CCMP1102 TaxID=635003 RepID=A0A1E7FMB2_9STRA|nr:hypothetical protein FRACYDRAFT_235350 [Fragilariopsis cylindrus CCMP1102]|eukprot:OEU19301.1 hypothetical protein FRACYDRAFT_235350 [Fragilariopsis cylindrus CCMP1102]